MKTLTTYIKNKIRDFRYRNLYIPGETVPVNMTKILKNPRNILIVPYNRMGTVLLATRVFKTLRDHFPSAKMTVAVHKSWSVLIKKDPTIDDVVTFDSYIENPFSKEFRSFGKHLAERHFDLAFFLSYQFAHDMAYLTRLSDADLRVSFRGSENQDFFNVEIVPAPGACYEVERYLEMFRTLGIEGSIREYTMTISDKIREKARLHFLPAGQENIEKRLVGFDLTREIVNNPISRKNAESIIKTFVDQLKVTVVVFFEPAKKTMAAELKENFGKSIILVEDRPVSLLAGMMSLCKFIVTHNTDLLQFAIALKLPTISILSKLEMRQWSPGENSHLIHVERTNDFWPSSDTLLRSVKKIVNNIMKEH